MALFCRGKGPQRPKKTSISFAEEPTAATFDAAPSGCHARRSSLVFFFSFRRRLHVFLRWKDAQRKRKDAGADGRLACQCQRGGGGANSIKFESLFRIDANTHTHTHTRRRLDCRVPPCHLVSSFVFHFSSASCESSGVQGPLLQRCLSL